MSKMMTRDEAVNALVERDVTRWGEAERAAAVRVRSALSHGLALNALAYYHLDAIDAQLARVAESVMTADDRRVLRSGG